MKNKSCIPSALPGFVAKTTRSAFKAFAFSSLLLPAFAYGQADTLLAIRDSNHTTRLTLFNTGGLVVGGSYDDFTTGANIPAAGGGTRMMWYPDRAAFRAGYVVDYNWDDANVGNYSFAAGENVRAYGQSSVALGARNYAMQQSSFAVGEQNVASGAASVAMGYHSHTNARQGSFVFGDRSTVDTIRAGVNHSANWRVSGGFRIFSSSNLSTGVTIQSGASVSNWGQSSAVISTSVGAMLTTGGVWTNASDVNRKHLFENVSGEDVLLKLRSLSVTRWGYKTEDSTVRHIGPMAQDFYAAFGLGSDNRSIGTVDADGISLAAIKALEVRTSQLAGKLEAMQAENDMLRQQIGGGEKSFGAGQAGIYALILLCAAGLAGFALRRRNTTAQH